MMNKKSYIILLLDFTLPGIFNFICALQSFCHDVQSDSIGYISYYRPNHAASPNYARRCGLLLQTVGWSVGLAQHWTLQKRLNRSRCLPFGLRTRTGPGNHVLDEVQIPPWEGATLRGRAAYCIRMLCGELCKNGWTDRKAVWDWDSGGPKEACLRWGAHWRHLANTTKLTVCGGDAACCQITLTTYFICFIDCCVWNKVYSSWVLNSVRLWTVSNGDIADEHPQNHI